MNSKKIKLIGYIVYFVCLFGIFLLLINMGWIIMSPKYTFITAALISLAITFIVETVLLNKYGDENINNRNKK